MVNDIWLIAGIAAVAYFLLTGKKEEEQSVPTSAPHSVFTPQEQKEVTQQWEESKKKGTQKETLRQVEQKTLTAAQELAMRRGDTYAQMRAKGIQAPTGLSQAELTLRGYKEMGKAAIPVAPVYQQAVESRLRTQSKESYPISYRYG